MAFISDEELNNIKNNVNIVNLISSYLPLTQKGKNYFGVCPFHDDHSPSMSVSEDKQIYKCFSCGASGNVFTFIENYENVNFTEAVVIAARFAGITINNEFKKKEDVHQNLYDIMNLSLKFYQNNLNTQSGIDACKYLEKRGITKNIIKEFEIGLSLDVPDKFYQLCHSKNISINDCTNLGLISHVEERFFDTFNKRIMFPIHNAFGQVVGYTGRIYKTDSQNKYMNSRENVIFKKGNILFNYHRAKEFIKHEKYVIVVEGNFDAIRLASEGIGNVVALMGTALTKEQIDLFKKLRAKVILVLDNDDAGEHATYAVGQALINEGIELGIVRLSGYKDPDEYILANGVEAFKNNIRNSINYIDFKMLYLKKKINVNKTEDLRLYIKQVLDGLKDANDDILVELTLNKISSEYNVSIDILKKEYDRLKSDKLRIEAPPEVETKAKNSKYNDLIINILYYMMNDIKYVKGFKVKLGYIKNKIYREISNEIIYYTEKNKMITLSDYLTYADANNFHIAEINEIIKNCKYDEFDDDVFEQYVKLVKKAAMNDQIKELKKQMKTELDENVKMDILKRLTELKKGSV